MTEQQKECIGEQLRKGRLKKKVSLEQVYKDIKIHPKVLTALEENKFEEFLSPTYVKAFIKSYCRYLGLDVDKILKECDIVCAKPEQSTLKIKGEEKPQISLPKINWEKYTKVIKKWGLPVAGGAVAILAAVLLLTFTSTVIKRAAAARNLKPKTKKVEKKVKEDPSLKKALSIPKNQPLDLVVKTKGDVWLHVISDGNTVFQSVLDKGSSETYRAEDKLRLWTGRGEYLDLTLNGHNLGSPGRGVIKKILLTRKGLSIEK